MKKLLSLRPLPDAVFCHNDLTALGAMKAILDAGLKIPEDIAIMGCGNVKYSDCLRVPLTTIDQDCEAIGERAPSSPSLLDSKLFPGPKPFFSAKARRARLYPPLICTFGREDRAYGIRDYYRHGSLLAEGHVTAVRMDRQSSRSRPPCPPYERGVARTAANSHSVDNQ